MPELTAPGPASRVDARPPRGWTEFGPPKRVSGRDLLRRYESYRWHQARELLALLPPEGLRALSRATGGGDGEALDPLARLRAIVLRVLPLPPFYVWYQDVCRHPEAHLGEAWMADLPDLPSVPLVLRSRVERLCGLNWNVELAAHCVSEWWQGSLVFSRAGEAGRWQTGGILRGPDVRALLRRFEELDRRALEAFLRSALP